MKIFSRRKRIVARLKSFWGLSLLFVLVSLSFSYAMFQGGFVSWFLFFSFLPFAIYSIIILLYPIQAFKVERSITPAKFKAGDVITVTITVRRMFPLPIVFLIIEDIVPSRFYNTKNKQMTFLGFRTSIKFTYQIDNIPRGEHIFEAIRLKSGDVLGLVEKERWFDCQQSLLVYPQYEEMIYRPFESPYEQGGASSALRFQKDTSLVSGVREYQPGDRFSWIDWKATARTNELVSKEFETRQTNDILLLLDREDSQSFEEMIIFTASVTKTIISHGGQMGLFSSGHQSVFFPIRGGEQQERKIFHHLAKVSADSPVPLLHIIKNERYFLAQPAVLMVITSKLNPEFIENIRRFIGKKGTLLIYCIQKRNAISNKERTMLKAISLQKGIMVKYVYEDEFRTAFTEVEHA